MSSSVHWPLHTVTEFVCRESLHGSFPHVVDLIGRFLDEFLPQRAFTEACRRGAATNDLEYFLEWTAPDWEEAVNAAARGGHLHVFEWMMKKCSEHPGPWLSDFNSALHYAATSNHLEVVKWLLGCKEWGRLEVTQGIDHAARNGNLEMIQVLEQYRPGSRSIRAIGYAASQGHFEVVQWIHFNLPKSSFKFVLYDTAKNGRLDMIQWLSQNGYDACQENVMDGALDGGHLHIAQWLLDHGGKCSKSGLVTAEQGNLEMLRWLHEHFTDRFTPRVMDDAARHNHLHVVKWLHKYRSEGCTTWAMDVAAARGHLDVLQWLHSNRHEGCSTKAMLFSAEVGQLDSIRWLHKNGLAECNGGHAMDFAATRGHLEIERYLYEHRIDECSAYGMTEAVKNGHYEVVRYLYDNNVCRSYGRAMRRAVDRGCGEVTKVLVQIAGRSCHTISGGYVVDKWATKMFQMAYNDRSAKDEILRKILQQLGWFSDYGYHGCVSRTLELALKSGHVSVVQRFFEHNGQAKCSTLFEEADWHK